MESIEIIIGKMSTEFGTSEAALISLTKPWLWDVDIENEYQEEESCVENS